MELLLGILELGKVLGLPATILVTCGIFVLKDHSKRLVQLEAAAKAEREAHSAEMAKLYERINSMAEDVAFIKGRMCDNGCPK